MSKDDTIILDPTLETTEDDFEFDAAINELAMNSLNYMNEQVFANTNIPEEEQFDVMFYALKAMLFNGIMIKADKFDVDPKESAEQFYEELMDAIEGMHGCCGGGEHHH